MGAMQVGFWSALCLACLALVSRRKLMASAGTLDSTTAAVVVGVAVLLVAATIRAAGRVGRVEPSETRSAIWGVGMIALILASLAIRLR